MAQSWQHEMDNFSLGAPALVCRWRLSAGTLLLGNRHMRALSHRIVNGAPVSRELAAWAKQHVEWTLAEGSVEHPDGVLMLIIDEAGAAAMTAGPYEPPAQRFSRALVRRAADAAREQEETGVAPEVLIAHADGGLIVASVPDAFPSGCTSLVLQLSATLGISVVYSPNLLAALEQRTVTVDGLFLASDEHGIVPATDCSDDTCRRFEAAYRKLFDTATRKRG